MILKNSNPMMWTSQAKGGAHEEILDTEHYDIFIITNLSAATDYL